MAAEIKILLTIKRHIEILRKVSLIVLAFMFSTSLSAYTDLSKAPAGEYELEKTHAYVALSYSHQGFSRPILLFRDIDASISVDVDNIKNSTLSVKIDPASIDSGVEIFNEHLLGEKLFDVRKYPNASFESTSFKLLANGHYRLRGKLTVKGVTKPIELDVTFNKGGMHRHFKVPHLGFSATGTVARSQWGLSLGVPFVGDKVELTIEVEFIKKGVEGEGAKE